MSPKTYLLLCIFLPLLAQTVIAGPVALRADVPFRDASKTERFEQNHFELSLVSGALFSPTGFEIFPRGGTSFDYTQTELRLGWMLNSPYEAGIFRGNFEVLLGLGGGAVVP